MVDNTNLSMEQMTAVLDNAPVAIYVTEVNSFELLYVNRLAKNLLMKSQDDQAICCYQAAGFDKPCPFCHAEEMSRTKLFIRDFYNPSDDRIYQLSGKLIDWGGRAAHIEYIQDITEKKKSEEKNKTLKEELQATFSNIPCGLCVFQFDEDRTIPLFHNPAFFEIMGYSEDHIRTLEHETNFLGVHPEDVDPLKEKLRQVISQECVLKHTHTEYGTTKEKNTGGSI